MPTIRKWQEQSTVGGTAVRMCRMVRERQLMLAGMRVLMGTSGYWQMQVYAAKLGHQSATTVEIQSMRLTAFGTAVYRSTHIYRPGQVA